MDDAQMSEFELQIISEAREIGMSEEEIWKWLDEI